MLEYYHADRLNYVVTGTPNRLEYDQGFFVKLGDGAADVKPIAHLYKTQVYALAEYLGRARRDPVPALHHGHLLACPSRRRSSTSRCPTTAWTCACTGRTTESRSQQVAAAAGLTDEQVQRVYRDIDQKRRTTEYLHLPPQLVCEVPEVRTGA